MATEGKLETSTVPTGIPLHRQVRYEILFFDKFEINILIRNY
jgi:hypothetical protein